MKLVTCPHCGHRHIVTSKVPQDVVVVLPCPSCQEFVVFFREKTIGLKREIIDSGTFEQRKEHIAEVIAEFLEGGLPWAETGKTGTARRPQPVTESEFGAQASVSENPITQKEVDRFVRIELQRIDDAAYFRKMFE